MKYFFKYVLKPWQNKKGQTLVGIFFWLDDTAFGAGTFSWQDPVHSWKAGPGEVMTVEKIIYLFDYPDYIYCKAVSIKTPGIRNTF